MNIFSTNPAVVLEDDDGDTLGVRDNPVESRSKTADDYLQEILMELKEMNEKLLLMLGDFS